MADVIGVLLTILVAVITVRIRREHELDGFETVVTFVIGIVLLLAFLNIAHGVGTTVVKLFG